MRPITVGEATRVLGNPVPYIVGDGFGVLPEWETKTLAWAKLPHALPLAWDKSKNVARFRCHSLLVPYFEKAFGLIWKDGDAWATIGDFGGCYNFRANRSNRLALSLHSWGAAIDLDVCDNPRGREPRVHPLVVAAFESSGFYWGGNFHGSRRDGMHFEFCDLAALEG